MTYKKSKSYQEVLSSKIQTKFSSESDLLSLEVSDKKLGSFQNEKTKAKENITPENVQCLQYELWQSQKGQCCQLHVSQKYQNVCQEPQTDLLVISFTMAMCIVIYTLILMFCFWTIKTVQLYKDNQALVRARFAHCLDGLYVADT